MKTEQEKWLQAIFVKDKSRFKMIEVNPDKISQAEIVVGLPSYNEAESIANVVKQVDQGLGKYFKHKKAVIINADNDSADKTGQVFLNTQTKTPKIYLSTPANIRGKGYNLRNIFLKMKEIRAKAGLVVDADLKIVRPEWVKCLLGPILEGYDHTRPIYYRNRKDGSITKHICFPLVYGLLGYNIRQPIGGEVGFSKRLVEYWLSQQWFEEAEKFGIDIFMTFNAIKGGFKLCQIDLGSKIHKPSFPKLDYMFLEVVGAFFKLLSENKNLWQKKINVKELPLVCQTENKNNYPELQLDYKQFEEKALTEFSIHYKLIKEYITPALQLKLEKIFLKEKSLEMDSRFWAQTVYEIFYIYQGFPAKNFNQPTDLDRETIVKFLRAIYFGKIAWFIQETVHKSRGEVEGIVQEQAQIFYKDRDCLLSLMESP